MDGKWGIIRREASGRKKGREVSGKRGWNWENKGQEVGEKWGVGGKGWEVGEKGREAGVLRMRESVINKC